MQYYYHYEITIILQSQSLYNHNHIAFTITICNYNRIPFTIIISNYNHYATTIITLCNYNHYTFIPTKTICTKDPIISFIIISMWNGLVWQLLNLSLISIGNMHKKQDAAKVFEKVFILLLTLTYISTEFTANKILDTFNGKHSWHNSLLVTTKQKRTK